MDNDYDAEKSILEDMKKVKEQIQEICYLGQFDIANQFNERLETIRQKVLKGWESKTVYSISPAKIDLGMVEYELEKISLDIEEFFDEKGNMLREKQVRENYQNKTNKIISSIPEKTTEELFADLTEIVNKWNTYNHSEIEKQIGEERIAKVVLKIFEGQAQKGETIDISVVNNYCNQDIFLDAIRQKLIRIVQKQDKDDANETLEKARSLKQEDLNDPNLWRTITSIENITIATKNNLQDIKDKKQSQNIELEPEEEKNEIATVTYNLPIERAKIKTSKVKQLINRIKSIGKDSTIYIVADIDEETGDYTNVRRVFDKFPPRELSDKDLKKVIEIEIRNKPTITIEDIERLYNRCFENNLEEIFPNIKTLIIGKGVKSIGNSVFKNMLIENLIIGDSVTEIGAQAFRECWKLEKVNLGKKIEKIGGKAFYNCYMLSGINIPNSIKEWGDNIFESCRRLDTVHIKEGIEKIGSCCFMNSGLKQVTLPNSLKEIGGFAFNDNRLKKIIIPDGVEVIENYAFGHSKLLKQITFGKNIKQIKTGAFKNCSLESVSIPDSVINLGNEAFKNNPLKNIHLGKGLEEIRKECFEGLNTEYIEIPSNIRRIENRSFARGQIKNIKINGLPQIASKAFEESDIDAIQMKGNSQFVNNLAFTGFNSIQKAIIDGKTYKFIQGIYLNDNVDDDKLYNFAVLTPEALEKLSLKLRNDRFSIERIEYPRDTEAYKPIKPIHEEAKEERRSKPDDSEIDGGDTR